MSQELGSKELDFFIHEPDLLPVYLVLRGQIEGLAPGCEVRVHKTTISFRSPRPYAYVSFLPGSRAKGFSRLWLSFSSEEAITTPLVMDSVFIRRGLYTVHAHVPHNGLLDEETLEAVHRSLQQRNRNEVTNERS